MSKWPPPIPIPAVSLPPPIVGATYGGGGAPTVTGAFSLFLSERSEPPSTVRPMNGEKPHMRPQQPGYSSLHSHPV